MITFNGEGGRKVAIDPSQIVRVLSVGAKGIASTLVLGGGAMVYVAEGFSTVVQKVARAKKK